MRHSHAFARELEARGWVRTTTAMPPPPPAARALSRHPSHRGAAAADAASASAVAAGASASAARASAVLSLGTEGAMLRSSSGDGSGSEWASEWAPPPPRTHAMMADRSDGGAAREPAAAACALLESRYFVRVIAAHSGDRVARAVEAGRRASSDRLIRCALGARSRDDASLNES